MQINTYYSTFNRNALIYTNIVPSMSVNANKTVHTKALEYND